MNAAVSVRAHALRERLCIILYYRQTHTHTLVCTEFSRPCECEHVCVSVLSVRACVWDVGVSPQPKPRARIVRHSTISRTGYVGTMRARMRRYVRREVFWGAGGGCRKSLSKPVKHNTFVTFEMCAFHFPKRPSLQPTANPPQPSSVRLSRPRPTRRRWRKRQCRRSTLDDAQLDVDDDDDDDSGVATHMHTTHVRNIASDVDNSRT